MSNVRRAEGLVLGSLVPTSIVAGNAQPKRPREPRTCSTLISMAMRSGFGSGWR